MNDLRDKIRNLIENEKQKGHFFVLDLDTGANLIQQILENYEKLNNLKQDFDNLPKKAELVFVAAPTGAGKDTLVARLNHQNPEKNYIELNMDIFRHYFPKFIEKKDTLTDKNFAEMTNEFAYEIFVTIQEILLQEFPGTNIIITGTLREIDWVEDTFVKFKNNEKTDYSVKLACLAVPKKESAISVIQRYVGFVNSQISILENYPGTARYTSMKYHDETFEKFPTNLEILQKNFQENPGEKLDSIEVYKRGKTIRNLDEDTIVYSSEDDEEKNALKSVLSLRLRPYKVQYEDIALLMYRIKKNKKYLKEQGTLREVIRDLAVILDYPEIVKRIDKLPLEQEFNDK